MAALSTRESLAMRNRIFARDSAELSYPPVTKLSDAVTPTERFFVRDHLQTHPVDVQPESWTIEVSGLVHAPGTILASDLGDLESVEEVVTLECAGNGNLRRGMLSAVGTATFSGVRLADVLARFGPQDGAAFVTLVGADVGTDPDDPRSNGRYARSIPLNVALCDALLAQRMNGLPLLPKHGHPVRAVVPGHYGMDSVKWLSQIVVSAEMDPGYYQQSRYREVRGEDGLHSGRYIRRPMTKSLVTFPGDGEVLSSDGLTIEGVAWSGYAPVEEVLVSLDGGRTWTRAELGPVLGAHAWRRWRFSPPEAASGTRLEVVARALDVEGNSQPLEPRSARSYEANWVHRIFVTVA